MIMTLVIAFPLTSCAMPVGSDIVIIINNKFISNQIPVYIINDANSFHISKGIYPIVIDIIM